MEKGSSRGRNTERTIPAESSVHQVPLDITLMVTADDFLLFELVLAVELKLGAELDDVELTVSCPEISEEKRACSEPYFTTECDQDKYGLT